MANLTVEMIEFAPWGRCVRLTNGAVELVATLDFGPRIICYGFVDELNMFFEDKEDMIVQSGDKFDKLGGGAWHIYGGHRLWTAPETIPRTTYPDNNSVQYQAIDGRIVLRPEEETWNQLQKEMEIGMDAETGRVTIMHRVTNTGPWAVSFAPWALSVMAPGGTAYIPQANVQSGFTPNRVLSLWPYSRMDDPRVTWGNRLITIRQGSGETPFKLGSNNEHGWAAYALHNHLFIKSYKHSLQGTYPDRGVSFEAYVCDHFLELETLGEQRAVEPGDTVSHEEVWQLFRGIELPIAVESELEQALGRCIQE